MKWTIVVGGRPITIDSEHLETVREVEPGVYSVLLGGQSFEIRLLPAGQGFSAEVNGQRLPVEVENPRDSTSKSRSARAGGRQNIAAPMPGKVIRVLVQQGQSVQAGEGLVVVEAMKMQNEMKASRPGTVVD